MSLGSENLSQILEIVCCLAGSKIGKSTSDLWVQMALSSRIMLSLLDRALSSLIMTVLLILICNVSKVENCHDSERGPVNGKGVSGDGWNKEGSAEQSAAPEEQAETPFEVCTIVYMYT